MLVPELHAITWLQRSSLHCTPNNACRIKRQGTSSAPSKLNYLNPRRRHKVQISSLFKLRWRLRTRDANNHTRCSCCHSQQRRSMPDCSIVVPQKRGRYISGVRIDFGLLRPWDFSCLICFTVLRCKGLAQGKEKRRRVFLRSAQPPLYLRPVP